MPATCSTCGAVAALDGAMCLECQGMLLESNVKLLEAQLARKDAALREAAEALDALANGECSSRYGPGCDQKCKSVAFHAWDKARGALADAGREG